MTARVRIEMLGGLRVRHGDRVIPSFSTQKTGVLLASLALQPRQPRPREVLIDTLWPEDERDAGLHKLSVALSSLRRQLEPPGVPAGTVVRADRFSVRL